LGREKAQATFDNGILTLTLPKAEAVKPKQIKVKAKGAVERRQQIGLWCASLTITVR
jgi:hypothetical protein